ncbi:MAG TPA: hypothetical protein VGC58_02890 [Candidatus Paceibacterota bacterium]
MMQQAKVCRYSFLFLMTVLVFSPSGFLRADVSNITNADVLSEPFSCFLFSLGTYQSLGSDLSGKLTKVDLKIKNPGPVSYGKSVYLEIYESNIELNSFNDVSLSNLVWGQSRFRKVGINNYDGIVTFSEPDAGIDYNFNSSKYYYLVPRFSTSDGGGICQNSQFYGSSGPGSFSNGQYFSDSHIQDLYFNLYGLSQSTTTLSGGSSVLFIPGLEASRLYKSNSSGGENQLWESNRLLDVEALYMSENGLSINPGIYTRDIIKETNTPFPSGAFGENIYKSFSDMMDDLVSGGKIKRWESYAYDWRDGVADIVNNGTNYVDGKVSLEGTLEVLAQSSKSGKVTIVAHSNGGLIARALLKKLGDDKLAGRNNLIDRVDVLILVAVPEIGTAVAIPAMLHGYDQRIGLGLLLDEIHARELGRNMPGGYGLLPSKEYINHVDLSPVSFTDNFIPSGITTNFVSTYGNKIDSYSEYKNFLFGNEGRVNPSKTFTNLPIKISPTLFAKSESLHDSIDTWTPPSSLRVIEIAGWGLDTVASFKYYPKFTGCISGDGVGCPSPYVLDQIPIFTSDGDKTVVVPSAHYMSFQGKAEKYWVDLPKHNEQIIFDLRRNREHKDILEVNSVNNLVDSVIGKKEIVFDSVLKNIKPVDDGTRTRVSVHSPVTIDAYDVEGNHTGKICYQNSDFCYVEEKILNSSYLEFGEGKYINLPEDQMFKVKLQGTGIGTFTYESEKVLPNGTSVTSYFVDIPVTTQTQAEITLNPNTLNPELKLDVTGDGIVDFTLKPSSSFDPVIYLQIMKSTIDSLDIVASKKVAFGKRVDNIIKLIQKGKVDKAKLKADKFKVIFEKNISKPDSKHPKPKKL